MKDKISRKINGYSCPSCLRGDKLEIDKITWAPSCRCGWKGFGIDLIKK